MNTQHAVRDAARQLDAAASASVASAARAYEALAGRLEALSPAHTLARGFALVQGQSGAYCGKAEALSPGESIRIVFQDGAARATVSEITHEQK